jgi:hypothetical protein
MTTTRALLVSFAVIAVASTAFAGLNDGIRPGPSPSPWLWKVGSEPAPYALAGRTTREPDREWTRELRQLGTKVFVDAYRR